MISGFRRIGGERVFDGHVISLWRDVFEAPDGSTFDREIVRHPGAVVVVPVTDDGHVVMIRQYRATVDEVLLEMPAGLLDHPGEPLEEAAQRELQEEVGLRAARLERLCETLHSPGFSDEKIVIFLATGLTEVGHDRQGPEEQFIEDVRVPLVEAEAWVADGRVRSAAAVVGLLIAANRFRS